MTRIVAVLVMAVAFSALLPPSKAAQGDLELSGEIYLADGSFLGDYLVPESAYANSTRFTIWINHGGSYFSYPSPSVQCSGSGPPISPGTCGGWYTVSIPAADRGVVGLRRYLQRLRPRLGVGGHIQGRELHVPRDRFIP